MGLVDICERLGRETRGGVVLTTLLQIKCKTAIEVLQDAHELEVIWSYASDA